MLKCNHWLYCSEITDFENHLFEFIWIYLLYFYYNFYISLNWCDGNIWTYWDLSDPFVCLCEDFVSMRGEVHHGNNCLHAATANMLSASSQERDLKSIRIWGGGGADLDWRAVKNGLDLSHVKWANHWGWSWTRRGHEPSPGSAGWFPGQRDKQGSSPCGVWALPYLTLLSTSTAWDKMIMVTVGQ